MYKFTYVILILLIILTICHHHIVFGSSKTSTIQITIDIIYSIESSK